MIRIENSCIAVPEAYQSTIIPGVFSLNLNAPLAIQFELTAGCNHNCCFCYNVWKDHQNLSPGSMTFSEKQEVICRSIEWGVFDIIFSGGEPLLDKNLPSLMRLAVDGGLETSLITNGALLSRAKCVELHRAGLGSMQISLHSPNSEKNDRITQKLNAYRATVQGICNAVDVFGGECINVNMVLIRDNYNEVLLMARFVKELGLRQFSVSPLSETGAALVSSQTLTREQFLFAYRELRDAERELNIGIGIAGGSRSVF